MSDKQTTSISQSSEPVVQLTKALLSVPSISPDTTGCQSLIATRLEAIGFSVRHVVTHGTKNMWARIGSASPLFVFSGHTDVVPAGDLGRWTSPPFEPSEREGKIFGRGAADMKGSIAAMVVACEKFLSSHPIDSLPFSIGFLITGDEETAGEGAPAILEELIKTGQKPDYCVVGEPTSEGSLGDTIKVGRRGSIHGKIKFIGRQGHTGYPHLANNAIHRCLEPLAALIAEPWDMGGAYFQPTTLQLSMIQGGFAPNVIPGEVEVSFNFRFSKYVTSDRLVSRLREILSSATEIETDVTYVVNAEPFLTDPNASVIAPLVTSAVEKILGKAPRQSTAGGTSDARFFGAYGVQVVELGPCNESIHKCDEHVTIEELSGLVSIYEAVLNSLCAAAAY